MDHRKVLVIDAPEKIEAMIKAGLLYYPIEMTFSTSKDDALKQIMREPPDLLISGLVYEDGTAVELLTEVNALIAYIPPGIYLAEADQKEVQNEVIKLGAVDVIVRPFDIATLHNKIEHAVSVMKSFNVKSRLERHTQRSHNTEEYDQLLEESKSLGIPVAELIKLKQLSSKSTQP